MSEENILKRESSKSCCRSGVTFQVVVGIVLRAVVWAGVTKHARKLEASGGKCLPFPWKENIKRTAMLIAS